MTLTPRINLNPTCDAVTVYRGGHRKSCAQPIDYSIGDGSDGFTHACRRHLAGMVDLVHARDEGDDVIVRPGRITKIVA
jgi:hypothetical protein